MFLGALGLQSKPVGNNQMISNEYHRIMSMEILSRTIQYNRKSQESETILIFTNVYLLYKVYLNLYPYLRSVSSLGCQCHMPWAMSLLTQINYLNYKN